MTSFYLYLGALYISTACVLWLAGRPMVGGKDERDGLAVVAILWPVLMPFMAIYVL